MLDFPLVLLLALLLPLLFVSRVSAVLLLSDAFLPSLLGIRHGLEPLGGQCVFASEIDILAALMKGNLNLEILPKQALRCEKNTGRPLRDSDCVHCFSIDLFRQRQSQPPSQSCSSAALPSTPEMELADIDGNTNTCGSIIVGPSPRPQLGPSQQP